MRRISPQKKFDLRNYHTIFFELGLIGALSLFIIATNIELKPGNSGYAVPTGEQEVVEMKEIAITKQEKLPPPPPPPQVPVAVPNDRVIEEQQIRFNSELDLDEPMPMPEEGLAEEKVSKEEEEKIFVVVEHPPELIGGLAELHKKIVYPKEAEKAGIEGLVVVQFIITKEGNVKDPVVMRGIGGGCDREALRVVRQARFKPGRQRGEPVTVRYSMPIRFKLRK